LKDSLDADEVVQLFRELLRELGHLGLQSVFI
jgi:hypothetical protein